MRELSPQEPPPERIPLGGLFESYEESYANAWRALMPDARKMALPILYLQRHTFELLVKSTLKGAIAERSTLNDLDELFGTTSGPGPEAPTDFELVHTTHAFSSLFPRLEANLAALGRGPLPDEFLKLRQLFFEVDEDRPDRLRFETLFSRKKGTTTRSFPHAWGGEQRKAAPCQEVADLLETVLAAQKSTIDHFVHESPPPDSLIGRFFVDDYEGYLACEGEVQARLSPITRASREGQLHWNEVQPADIRIEPPHSLERLAKDVNGGLCANFEGRPLVLIWLKGVVLVSGTKGKHHEDAFFLAAQRSNGTITAGVWPSDYQSNLANEAIRSFRRDSGFDK